MNDNTKNIRCFLAVPLPESVRAVVYRNVKKKLAGLSFIKMVPSENYHITIKFFGNVSVSFIDNLINFLETVNFTSFQTDLSDCGFFPSRNHPKVLWYSAADHQKILLNMFRQISKYLESLDIKQSDMLFKPHITLARLKTIRNSDFIKLYKAHDNLKMRLPAYKPFFLQDIILYKSELTKQGSIYTVLWHKKCKI